VVAVREFVDIDLLTVDIIVELDGIELALDVLDGTIFLWDALLDNNSILSLRKDGGL
jgi:hypothetical protein